MQSFPIKTFGGLNVTDESTDAPPNSLAVFENAIARPAGAIQRPPVFTGLWGTGLVQTGAGGVIRELTYTKDGRVSRVLVAHNPSLGKALGIFWIGDPDGGVDYTIGTGGLDAGGGVASQEILIENLDPHARVYFQRIYNEVWIGNGVNPNMIYSLERTPKIRPAGTSIAPVKPAVDYVASPTPTPPAETIPAIQASLIIVLADGSLTLTADAAGFEGASGNYIRIKIENTLGDLEMPSSTRSGSGDATDPLVYTLKIGKVAANSCGNALKFFIDGDTLAQGVITATLTGTGEAENPTLTLAEIALVGGADEIIPGQFPPTFRCRVATCLYDPGVGESPAYEGPRSALSKELYNIAWDSIKVTIAQVTGAHPRFTHQTIWLQVYKGTAFPINPNGPFQWMRVAIVQNIPGNYSIPYSFKPLIVQDTEPRQSTVPPCTMFEIADGRVWSSGNAAQKNRIWLSKFADGKEKAPEGANIDSWLDIEGRRDDSTFPAVTAIRRLEGRMQVHTDRSVTFFDSVTLRRIVSRSDIGAMNPACLAGWGRPAVPYIGADGAIYQIVNTQYYRSESANAKAAPVVRSLLAIREIAKDPGKATLLADSSNELLFAFVPRDGAMRCFMVDARTWAVSGPIIAPQFVGVTSTGATDNRFIGITESCGIMVLNLNNLHDIESFAPSDPFQPTPNVEGYTPPPDWIISDFPPHEDGIPGQPGNLFYEKGYLMVIETQWLYLNAVNTRKGFYSLDWSVPRNSRGIAKVIIKTDNGHTKEIKYGDVYGRERHKVAFCMSGNAVKARLEIIVAEDKPFALRDLTLGWESQANL